MPYIGSGAFVTQVDGFTKNEVADIFVGSIAAFGTATAPDKWLSCDGTAVSRSTYAKLFARIGTTWGVGDGSTTFNLPDLRGAFLRGTGSHGSETMANGNPFAGPSVGVFEDDQIQGHHHTSTSTDRIYPLAGGSFSGGLAPYGTDRSGSPYFSGAKSPTADPTNGTPRTGAETAPFSAGVLYCIYTGV